MTNRIQKHSGAHRDRPEPAELGQTEAKLERRGEEKLRHMGDGSNRSVEQRHAPKLGQKRAEREAASNAATRRHEDR